MIDIKLALAKQSSQTVYYFIINSFIYCEFCPKLQYHVFFCSICWVKSKQNKHNGIYKDFNS